MTEANGPRTFDATSLRDREKCPHYFYLRHVCGYLAVGEKSDAMQVGIAIHSALAQFWRGEGAAEMEAALVEKLGSAPPVVMQALRAYALLYEQKRSECKVLLCEEVLESKEARLGGVLDLVLGEPDGTIVVVDHKTTSYKSADWLQQFRHSLQMAIYLKLAEARFGRKPRLAIDILRLPRGVTGKVEFDWQEFELDEELVEELWAGAQGAAVKAGRQIECGLAGAKNTSNCFAFSKLCPFAQICFAPPRRRAAAVELMLANGSLEVKPWDFKNREG